MVTTSPPMASCATPPRTEMLYNINPRPDNNVRKAPSWPKSWANLSLSQPHSHRNEWANLYLLGQPDAFPFSFEGPAALPEGVAAAGRAQDLARVLPGAQDRASPNFMGLTSLGLGIGGFFGVISDIVFSH